MLGFVLVPAAGELPGLEVTGVARRRRDRLERVLRACDLAEGAFQQALSLPRDLAPGDAIHVVEVLGFVEGRELGVRIDLERDQGGGSQTQTKAAIARAAGVGKRRPNQPGASELSRPPPEPLTPGRPSMAGRLTAAVERRRVLAPWPAPRVLALTSIWSIGGAHPRSNDGAGTARAAPSPLCPGRAVRPRRRGLGQRASGGASTPTTRAWCCRPRRGSPRAQLPYRDFYANYGPGQYFLVGGLDAALRPLAGHVAGRAGAARRGGGGAGLRARAARCSGAARARGLAGRGAGHGVPLHPQPQPGGTRAGLRRDPGGPPLAGRGRRAGRGRVRLPVRRWAGGHRRGDARGARGPRPRRRGAGGGGGRPPWAPCWCCRWSSPPRATSGTRRSASPWTSSRSSACRCRAPTTAASSPTSSSSTTSPTSCWRARRCGRSWRCGGGPRCGCGSPRRWRRPA